MPDCVVSLPSLKRHAEHCAICSRLDPPILCLEGERMVRNLYRTMLNNILQRADKRKSRPNKVSLVSDSERRCALRQSP